jgi:hypothetical protein
MIMKIRLATFVSLALVACTYGPRQSRYTMDGLMPRPNTRTFAAAIRTVVFRPPAGISTFPDGGAQRTEEQFVTVFAGDVDSGTVRLLYKLAAPTEVISGFQITILGWKPDAMYAVVTGCPRIECGAADGRRLYYRFALDGSAERIPELPTDLERPYGMGARAPGETVYTRMSSRRDTITVCTLDEGPYVPRYLVDSGVVVPLVRATRP